MKIKTIENNDFNEDYYNKYIDGMLDWQKEAFDSINNEDEDEDGDITGQIIAATGSGKTYLQISLMIQHLKENISKQNIYMIASHRLLLNKQLLIKICGTFSRLNVDYEVLFVGSDGDINEDLKKLNNELSDNEGVMNSTLLKTPTVTTSSKIIREVVKKSKENKKHLIIVSTYDSLVGVKKCKIDMALYDEAHKTVGKECQNVLEKVNPYINNVFYFTATRKVGKENYEHGMENKDVYGDVIYTLPNSKAITDKIITGVKLHIIENKLSSDTINYSDKIDTIIAGFEEHDEQLKLDSFDSKEISPKMLVTLNSIKEVEEISSNKQLLEYCNGNDIKLLSISSGKCSIDGLRVYKKDIEKELDRLKDEDTEKCLILHIKMLSEGIDVPGLTSTFIFDRKNISSLSQIIGRCLRLNETDRWNLLNDKKFKDILKPFGYVLLPMFVDEEDMRDMKQMIEDLYKCYGVIDEPIIRLEQHDGETKPKEDDDLGDEEDDSKSHKKDLRHTIEEIIISVDNNNKKVIINKDIEENIESDVEFLINKYIG